MNRKELLRQTLHVLIGVVLIIGHQRQLLLWWHYLFIIVLGYGAIITIEVFGLHSWKKALVRVERASTPHYGWGALALIKGFLIASVLFPHNIATIAMIVLVFGDSTATVVGKKCGNHSLFWNAEKSIEGSLAGLLIATSIAATITSFPLALIASAAGMLAETTKRRIILFDDNLLIPLVAGTALLLASIIL